MERIRPRIVIVRAITVAASKIDNFSPLGMRIVLGSTSPFKSLLTSRIFAKVPLAYFIASSSPWRNFNTLVNFRTSLGRMPDTKGRGNRDVATPMALNILRNEERLIGPSKVLPGSIHLLGI
ncbi:hypothetical protein CDL15_Pgr010616 [Punica granatum]|uniref:Uncharacterized protein n=1 Tax=Punica granatum TaxID=22663 RepID=A0A218VS84_PUNGR|nr:hypothetical protein CDL15_Pgr010616 [Punica granatum]PKI33832.1 hypothetical protein CRG98_045777 [Punica granatum]